MVSVFELMDSGVRVTIDERIGERTIGTSSYMVSYLEFKKHLHNLQKEKIEGSRNGGRDDVKAVRSNWGVGSNLRLPIDCVEVGVSVSGKLVVRQLISGGGNPLFECGEGSKKVDTSRFIVDFEVSKNKTIEKVSVSTFKGLLYGKHKPENIVHNELLTRKMKRDFEGKTYREIWHIETSKILRNLKEDDVRLASNNTLQTEIERVQVEGGAINWEVITC